MEGKPLLTTEEWLKKICEFDQEWAEWRTKLRDDPQFSERLVNLCGRLLKHLDKHDSAPQVSGRNRRVLCEIGTLAIRQLLFNAHYPEEPKWPKQ